MILEELIAKIGFKVDSIAPVEKAIGALGRLRTGLRYVARENGPLEKKLGDLIGRGIEPLLYAAVYAGKGMRALGFGMGQTTNASKKTEAALSRVPGRLARVALLGTHVGRVVNGLNLAFSAVGGSTGIATGGIGAMAAAFSYFVVKAAQARKELALFAKTNNTTTPRVDVLSQGLGKLGLTPEQAQSAVGSIEDKVSDAVASGKSPQLDWLTKMGVFSAEPSGPTKGKRIDPAAVLRAFIGAYIARNAKIEGLRKQETDAMGRGDTKGAAAARVKIKPLEDGLTKTEKDSGLGKDFFGHLRMSPSVEDYRKGEVEGASQRPTATKKQDEEAKRVSDGLDGMTNRFGGLADAFTRFATPAVASGIAGINSFLDKIIFYSKANGQMNLTEAEKSKFAGPIVSPGQEKFNAIADSIVNGIKSLFQASPGSGQSKFNRMMDGAFGPVNPAALGKSVAPTITDSGNDNRTFSIPVTLGVLEHQVMAAEVQRQISRAVLGIGPTAAKIGGTTGLQTTP